MKRTLSLLLVQSLLPSLVHAQPIFLYDQQSSDEARIREGGIALGMQPLGQSFTPTRSAVGFIRVFVDGYVSDTAVLQITLRRGSLDGPVIASTEPVCLSANFVSGPVDFLFLDPASVVPGLMYCFQPMVVSGRAGLGVNASPEYQYPGGEAFWYGLPRSYTDLWFREGLIIPEPAAGTMVGIGVIVITIARGVASRKRGEAGPPARPMPHIDAIAEPVSS